MKTNNLISTPIQSGICEIPPSIKLIREFTEFVQFCAMPRVLREIKTQREFAQKFEISEDTLTDWKRTPGFLNMVRQLILEREQEGLSDVINALYKQAKKGKPGAAKLWLQYVGELQTKRSNNKN